MVWSARQPLDRAPCLPAAVCGAQIVRPVLGVSIAPPQTLRQLGLEGVLVLEVPQGTPAAKAGIQGTYRHVLCSDLAVLFLFMAWGGG